MERRDDIVVTGHDAATSATAGVRSHGGAGVFWRQVDVGIVASGTIEGWLVTCWIKGDIIGAVADSKRALYSQALVKDSLTLNLQSADKATVTSSQRAADSTHAQVAAA